jgi:hypothetical protein
MAGWLVGANVCWYWIWKSVWDLSTLKLRHKSPLSQSGLYTPIHRSSSVHGGLISSWKETCSGMRQLICFLFLPLFLRTYTTKLSIGLTPTLGSADRMGEEKGLICLLFWKTKVLLSQPWSQVLSHCFSQGEGRGRRFSCPDSTTGSPFSGVT